MTRPLEEVAGERALDDAAGVHHEHAMAGAGDDSQIMGNENDRETALVQKLAQELEDLRLDGDVESRGGLVGDQELGIAEEGHGDHDALAHAATELMGVTAEAGGSVGNVDALQELERARSSGLVGEAEVKNGALGQLFTDAEIGVQASHWILEDHGDAAAANMGELGLGQADELLAVEANAARSNAPVTRQEAEDAQAGGALAAAGFADDAQHLATSHVERDTIHGAHGTRVGAKLGVQIADLEQGGLQHDWATSIHHTSGSSDPRRRAGRLRGS
jgi:hypothetical protein